MRVFKDLVEKICLEKNVRALLMPILEVETGPFEHVRKLKDFEFTISLYILHTVYKMFTLFNICGPWF